MARGADGACLRRGVARLKRCEQSSSDGAAHENDVAGRFTSKLHLGDSRGVRASVKGAVHEASDPAEQRRGDGLRRVQLDEIARQEARRSAPASQADESGEPESEAIGGGVRERSDSGRRPAAEFSQDFRALPTVHTDEGIDHVSCGQRGHPCVCVGRVEQQFALTPLEHVIEVRERATAFRDQLAEPVDGGRHEGASNVVGRCERHPSTIGVWSLLLDDDSSQAHGRSSRGPRRSPTRVHHFAFAPSVRGGADLAK